MNFKVNFKDKLFTDAINSSIVKLPKYYPRIGVLDNKSKGFYIFLILDFRIKEEGLKALNLSTGFISNIKTRLKTDFDVYKADYLRDNLIINNDEDINLCDAEDIDELGIYASDDDLEEDEITAYLSEKRLSKNAFKLLVT
ncbi:hypothetical protein BKA65DRAFT_486358 [Rhexocercosporidium sp. MPI-PUGE-AT-0058]|nr:hypothetical protein BKA65DRAFT_486358 [Rhexocercosporidium sp. MPI-PUGE-AT-0058]